MKEVYLDNNATTIVAPEVQEALLPFLTETYGNPSSLHQKGIEAERALGEARRSLADRLNVSEREIVFTSGATESDNLAVRGIARAHAREGTHIVTTAIEHEAVLDTVMELTEEGFQATFIKPDEYGHIDPADVAGAVRDDTILVAVMHVNNELGTVNDINTIGKQVKEAKSDVYMMVDGAQAFGKIPVSLENIDCYAASGHKIHAPKGVGFLFVRDGTALKPMQTGGGQEFGLRSGTENVAGIVGLSRAVDMAYENLDADRAHKRTLREKLVHGVCEIDGVRVNSPDDALENTVSIAFPGVPAEVLLNALDEKGIYVSAGAACSSNKQRESHVLKALDVPEEVRASTLRFGFSRYTTEDDIAYVVRTLQELVPSLKETLSK